MAVKHLMNKHGTAILQSIPLTGNLKDLFQIVNHLVQVTPPKETKPEKNMLSYEEAKAKLLESSHNWSGIIERIRTNQMYHPLLIDTMLERLQ